MIPRPPFSLTSLSSTRSLLNISSKDASKFLQGLVTNDVTKVHAPGGGLVYAALLKADGRMQDDLFIFPSSPTSTSTSTSTSDFLLDHPSPSTSQISSYLKRHILRSKVRIKPCPAETEVYAVWPDYRLLLSPSSIPTSFSTPEIQQSISESTSYLHSLGAQPDLRAGLSPLGLPRMGYRFLSSPLSLPPSIAPSSSAHYTLHRYLLSVPELPADFQSSNLPLEMNVDLMRGIDYRKGCYVGQELTARTKWKGVVRKRGMGVRLWREGEEEPTSFLPPSYLQGQTELIPYPDLYPLPSPSSSLFPLTSSSPTTPPTPPTRKPRAPRPVGKLGGTMSVLSSGGQTLTFGFASLRLPPSSDRTEILSVEPPSKELGGEVGDELEESGEEGRWVARGWVGDWVREELEELEGGE